MKFSSCLICRHKIFTFLLTPQFCRNCGSERIDTISYAEWIFAALIILAAIYFIAWRKF